MFYSIMNLPSIKNPFLLLFLMAFILICEYYPMPFRKGNSSLTFPVIYLIYLVHGLEITIVLYFISVLLTALLNKRPIRIIFFNPAQLVLSLTLVHIFNAWIMPLTQFSEFPATLLSFLVFISSFYLINNLIVDIVLFLRPEKYSFSIWAEKGRGEIFSFSISLVYGFLIHFLGERSSGEVDVFSYFFFLSPLIFLAIISSTIIRLRADKQRLKALFHFSSELNKSIPIIDWEDNIKILLNKVVSYEESFLFTRDEKKTWRLAISEGYQKLHNEQFEDLEELNRVRVTTVYNKGELNSSPLSKYFNDHIHAAVYAPLILDHELVGCLILTKTRTKSFVVQDVHSISTIANQLAIFLKTQMLFSEKEQRILLEERNRIAHDIHDGIAQTLAGAVMKLDIAEKKVTSEPKVAQSLISDSNNVLRKGLKEIRDSIYALRPYPTEQVGLHTAINNKIDELSQETDLDISFESRGIQIRLSLLTEKVIFSIIQESIRNCMKHAQASKINVLLSYQKEQIYLKVKDNGIGFSLYEAMTAAMKEPHYGIIQMNEDAAKVGATLQIDSREISGTEIIVRIPKLGYEGEEVID
ncbi:sensor histidine kinase [Paenisporosarcina sp. TG20]|uniref:GAF domain-containing sensor histidine kinase n=1 Tax=Paenisporosarcina sp. TG20 TaxID=1211706 RepID=UPI00036AED5B|nr:sensor histidine kinase [Paenisporosarcina sp. TG20]